MPPKTNAVDGISKSPPSGTLPRPAAPSSGDKKETTKPVNTSKPVAKNKIEIDSDHTSPIAAVLITVLVMAILIGLAYFAYTKSK